MKIEIVSMFTLRPVRKSHISVWLTPPVLPAIVVLAGLHISQFGLFLQSCLPLLFSQGFVELACSETETGFSHSSRSEFCPGPVEIAMQLGPAG